jgi:hypothetical protein
MTKRRTFISFDYDYDSFLKEAVVGQAKNSDSPFEISDWSLKEELSGDWKTKVRTRIRAVDVIVVICGEHTHVASGVTAELKIAQEEGISYFLLKGYPDRTCTKPIAAKTTDEMYNWTWDNLKKLIGGAR